MNVTYIYHSGFLVELEKTLLLFDYYKGQVPALDPDKDLYVFSSHSHHDHFSKDIFKLNDIHPKVTFIMSDDIAIDDPANERQGQDDMAVDPVDRKRIHFIKANEEKILANGQEISPLSSQDNKKHLQMKTLASTDEGVAFIVSIEGQVIYHAGDLNWWTWEGETKEEYQDMTGNFFAEVAKINKVPIDLAFLPLDPRQEDRFYLGFDHYMRMCDIKHVMPMHFWEDFSIIGKLKEMDEAKEYASKIIDIVEEGQVFTI